MKTPLVILVVMLLVPLVKAQVKEQVFVGTGGSLPAVGDPSPTIAAGGALLFPLSPRLFVRPAAVFSQNFPREGRLTRQIQSLVFLGVRLNQRFTILGGGGEAFLFPQGKASLHLATVLVSTATTIRKTAHGKWGLFTPISHNAKGWGVGLQVGYTW